MAIWCHLVFICNTCIQLGFPLCCSVARAFKPILHNLMSMLLMISAKMANTCTRLLIGMSIWVKGRSWWPGDRRSANVYGQLGHELECGVLCINPIRLVGLLFAVHYSCNEFIWPICKLKHRLGVR